MARAAKPRPPAPPSPASIASGATPLTPSTVSTLEEVPLDDGPSSRPPIRQGTNTSVTGRTRPAPVQTDRDGSVTPPLATDSTAIETPASSEPDAPAPQTKGRTATAGSASASSTPPARRTHPREGLDSDSESPARDHEAGASRKSANGTRSRSDSKPATRKPTATSSLTPSCGSVCAALRSIKRWSGWRYLVAFIVYAGALAEPVLMLALGASGSTMIPAQWRFWFCEVGDNELGGMGWCDSSGSCQSGFFYDVPAVSSSFWPGTMILSGLLLIMAGAGALLLLSHTLLVLRLVLLRTQCCPCCTDACTASCAHTFYDAEAQTAKRSRLGGLGGGDRPPRSLERWWFETALWVGMWVVGVLAAVIFAWEGSANGTGLAGEQMLNGLVCVAASWFFLHGFYRASWKGVSEERPRRPERTARRTE